ncbi:cell division protein ZapA [Zooshikella harenae]|uniref:Cell division protein ZapA n=1 Tax=Zooshikella harenae TaxID=2827238 RepID=A0ABS5ZEV9_9GAMM|nr:cell division protein ZapA [Zooshikella harenae]MBU2712599.1 cell division protein ZapA [Zooshikella harenae]
MSNSAVNTTTVSILDKDYRVSCGEEEKAALVEAANYLDSKMRDIRGTGKVIGLERIAVMAALNIAHELLQLAKSISKDQEETKRQVEQIVKKVDKVLQDVNSDPGY